ncbi:protein D3-like [Vanessa cardui]|uniref:protein D3-like n=1 Tax=Vanessa cardui TaxID=171605 RepID=UPI001F13F741|nr:protein D3-like [Vanessa cardui]
MSRLLRLAFYFLLAENIMINFMVLAGDVTPVIRAFEEYNIVSDVIPKAPPCLVKVKYPSGVQVYLGNELTPTQVRDEPSVTWNAEPDNYYVLAMTDPDVSNLEYPIRREMQHWLVGNIPGSNVSSGETIAEYLGSAPPPSVNRNRYVFLVYQQPDILVFDEPRISNRSAENRDWFSIANFAKKYGLGDPINGNFYLAQYDDYVPIIHGILNQNDN